MLNKEQLFKEIKEKGITEGELVSKYDEFKKFFEEHNVGVEHLEQTTLARIQSFYKKLFISPSILFEGIVYGVDRITDFGALRLYERNKKAYEEDKERAVAEGLTDEEGNPLYSGSRAPKDGSKRKINLKADRIKPVYLVAKKVGKEGIEGIEEIEGIEGEEKQHTTNKDNGYKKTTLNLRPNKFKTRIPLLKKVRFRANISSKTTEQYYSLNQSELTKFEIIDDNEINFKEFIKTYFKDNICLDLNNLKEWHSLHENDFNRKVVIKGNVSNIRFLTSGYSNIVNVDAPELGFDGNLITCWIPQDININFDESAMDVIIMGQTILTHDRFTGEEKVSINACCLWCPEVYRIKPDEQNQELEIRQDMIRDIEIKENESVNVGEKERVRQSFVGVKIEERTGITEKTDAEEGNEDETTLKDYDDYIRNGELDIVNTEFGNEKDKEKEKMKSGTKTKNKNSIEEW